MPTIAPRFQSEGVRVGSMPVPDVKPSMGGAQSLAAIGETLAGLGKTVSNVQKTQDQRQAVVEHSNNIRVATDKSVVSDKLKLYKIKLKESEQKFDTDAKRGRIPIAMEAHEKFLSSGSDEFTKDLTPEQLAIFVKDKEVEDYASRSFMRSVSHSRMQSWNLETAQADYNSAVTSAAYARATGDDALYKANIDKAHARAQDAGKISGATYDPQATQERVELEAMRKIIEDKKPQSALQFYERGKKAGTFGRLQAEADSVIAPQADQAWADTQDQVLAMESRVVVGKMPDVEKMGPETGIVYKDLTVYDADAAAAKVMGMEGVSPERKELLLKNIDIRGRQETARREALGASALQSLEAAQKVSDAAARSWLESHETKAALDLTTLKQRNVIYDRFRRGPEHSNPEHVAQLQGMLISGDMRELAQVKRSNYSVSNAEWEKFDAERKLTDDPLTKKITQFINDKYEDGGQKVVPRATREKPLSPKEQIEFSKIDATRRYVSQLMDNPDVKARIKADKNAIYTVMDEAYTEATRKIQITANGEQIWTTVAEKNLLPLGFTVTDDLRERAGVSDMREPMAREKVERRYKMEQDEQISKEMEAERMKQFIKDRRPLTDAEMRANRNRIGAAWRRGGAQDAIVSSENPTSPGWALPGTAQEDAAWRAQQARPMGTVTGPNAGRRDF